MNKLIKNTAIYTLGNILPQAMVFILLPLYTKYLTTEQFGIISSMQVIQVMLAIILSLSLERSIIRLYWDYKTEELQKKFLGTVGLTISINAFFILILVFILQNYIQKIFKSISFSPYYSYAILTSFFLVFSLVPKNYYRLKNQAGKFFFISFLQVGLSASFIVWFMVGKGEAAKGVLKGRMLAFALLVPLFIYLTIKFVKLKIDFGILRNSLSFCLPIIPTLLAAWILSQLDRIFIAQYFSLSDVGIYSLSRRIASLVSLLSGAFLMAYHPIFFELANSNDQDYAKKKLYKYNNTYIILIILFCFLIIFFSKEFIQLFLDSRYHSAYLYIPLIAVAYLFGSISSTVVGAFFQQSKKMKQDMFIGVGGAGINIFLCFLLIKPFGAAGAVWVTLISSIFIFSVAYLYAKKNCFFIPINWKSITVLMLVLFGLIILFQYVIDLNIYISLTLKIIILTGIGLFFIKKYLYQIKTMLIRS